MKKCGIGRIDLERTAFVVTLAILTGLAIWIISAIRVNGKDDIIDSNAAYQRELEDRYSDMLRYHLEMKGYSDCGITLNTLIDGLGNRSYHVLIHHNRITALPEEERMQLLDELGAISFIDTSSAVDYEFVL